VEIIVSTATTKKPLQRPKPLTPVRGSNPDNRPVPTATLLDSFYQAGIIHPELSFITSLAVGHAVSVYAWSTDSRMKEISIDFVGFCGSAYQVMRWDESDGPGKEFWRWHLWERPQWYSTPESACAAYVASYRQWLKDHPETP
jgi:hypothetical protein